MKGERGTFPEVGEEVVGDFLLVAVEAQRTDLLAMMRGHYMQHLPASSPSASLKTLPPQFLGGIAFLVCHCLGPCAFAWWLGWLFEVWLEMMLMLERMEGRKVGRLGEGGRI